MVKLASEFTLMKKLYTLLAAGLMCLGASAQISLEKNEVTVKMGYTEYERTVYLKVYNESTSDDCEVAVKRTVMQEAFGSINYFCFGNTCYPANTSESDPNDNVTVAPQASDASFTAYYNPEGVAGVTKLLYSFTNVNDNSDNDEIVITFDATEATVGIAEHQADVQVSYNPNSRNIVVALQQANDKGSIAIRDITGKLVFTDAVNFNKAVLVIPTEGLKPGIHLISILNAEGASIATKRVSIF